MADPTRSRSRSEAAPEVNPLRRVGEALLLAQSRARASAERANRSEGILRSVLSQINLQSGVLLHELEDYPRSLSLDTLADWELVQTLIEHSGGSGEPSRYPSIETEHATFALSMAEARAAPHTMSSLPHEDDGEDLRAVTRDVVMNLHLAARTADRRIEKMNSVIGSAWRSPGWLARLLQTEVYYYFRPWQLMAGVVIGFALGVATTRRLLLEKALAVSAPARQSVLVSDHQHAALPLSSSTCRGDAVTNRQIAKFHLAASRLPVTFAMEDMTHLLHAPAEVSS